MIANVNHLLVLLSLSLSPFARALWTRSHHRQDEEEEKKGKKRKGDRFEQDEKEFNFGADIYDDCRTMECIYLSIYPFPARQRGPTRRFIYK